MTPEKPAVKYCSTRDGGKLAYFELGDGPPLVYLPPLPQHLLLSWDFPYFRDQYLWLASRHRLIRYDIRGVGMSTAPVERNLEAEDLEDLVDHLGLESFSIMALAGSGLTAISYAAAHPDRVSRMVLWNVYPSTPDLLSDPRIVALNELARQDWALFLQTLSNVVYGWEDSAIAAKYADLLRASITQAEWLALTEAQRDFSVIDLLPQIRASTLIVQNESFVGTSMNPSSVLASGIPNASLRMTTGAVGASSFQDASVSDWLGEFLSGEARTTGVRDPGNTPGAFRAVLFTDLVRHAEMMSQLGDEAGRTVLREHERITREVLAAHGGTEVKTMGDGFMASFGSVTKAVECAVALQRKFEVRREKLEVEDLAVRIGLNAGGAD